jgi:hypothetical protein
VPTLSRLSLAGSPAGRETTSAQGDRGGDAAISGRALAVPDPRRANAIPADPGIGSPGLAARPPLRALAAPGPQRPATGHVVPPPGTGLHLPRRVSFEAWLDIGRQLSNGVSWSAWCLGDWLIYGETAFTGRYREAIERTSLDYKTLRNYAWVARRFPVCRRREELSFGHHAEVAALPEPEQDYWLRKAEQLGWSRNKIRHEVRASHWERNAELPGGQDPHASSPDGQAGPETLSIVIEVTPEQLRLYRQTAGQHGHSLQAWASLILDHAARGGLRSASAAHGRPLVAARRPQMYRRPLPVAQDRRQPPKMAAARSGSERA